MPLRHLSVKLGAPDLLTTHSILKHESSLSGFLLSKQAFTAFTSPEEQAIRKKSGTPVDQLKESCKEDVGHDWVGGELFCAPETDKLALPLPIFPCDLEQNDAPCAGAVLAEEVGRACDQVGLQDVRLRVAHQLGRQRAGGLPLLQGFTPHCLLPLARLDEPHLQRKGAGPFTFFRSSFALQQGRSLMHCAEESQLP